MLIFQLFSVNYVTTTLLQEILYKLTDHTSYVGQDRLVALLTAQPVLNRYPHDYVSPPKIQSMPSSTTPRSEPNAVRSDEVDVGQKTLPPPPPLTNGHQLSMEILITRHEL